MTDPLNALKLELLLRLPWTIRVERDEHGGESLTVSELPAVVAIGDTPKEMVEDLWEAMRSVLSAYLEEQVRPPLPASVDRLPWEHNPPSREFVDASHSRVSVTLSMASYGPATVFDLQPV